MMKKKIRKRREISYNKFDCSAGTFLRSKVKMVTNPNVPAANHSGTAAHRNPL